MFSVAARSATPTGSHGRDDHGLEQVSMLTSRLAHQSPVQYQSPIQYHGAGQLSQRRPAQHRSQREVYPADRGKLEENPPAQESRPDASKTRSMASCTAKPATPHLLFQVRQAMPPARSPTRLW